MLMYTDIQYIYAFCFKPPPNPNPTPNTRARAPWKQCRATGIIHII